MTPELKSAIAVYAGVFTAEILSHSLGLEVRWNLDRQAPEVIEAHVVDRSGPQTRVRGTLVQTKTLADYPNRASDLAKLEADRAVKSLVRARTGVEP